MLLGAAAIKQRFGGTAQLSKLHGKARTLGGRTYFLSYHPASATRFPSFEKAMHDDLERLKKLLQTNP